MTTIEGIADVALRRGIRIAVAESLTCGLLASELGKGHDAAEWFAGGVIAYQTGVKERLLGLRQGADPCSAECAIQLATGVRKLFASDIGISATGVGGPDPEGGHAPGTVYLGWSWGAATGHRRVDLDGGPAEILKATVASALELLAEQLGISPEPG